MTRTRRILAFFVILTLFSVELFAITYSSSNPSISFSVPDYWNASQKKSSNGITYGYKVSNQDLGTITFKWMDYYASLSYSQQRQYKRSQINNSLFSTNDIKSMISGMFKSGYSIKEVTVEGKKYFLASGKPTSAAVGYENNFDCYYYVWFSNGYLYGATFLFMPDSTKKGDVTSIMNSFVY